jgi:hypothetical protein
MVLYFKKHLQRHMTDTGLAGTEHMSLVSACQALELHCAGCTSDKRDAVAEAMEVLRMEAERGETRSDDQLAWDLSYAIAEQHSLEAHGGM